LARPVCRIGIDCLAITDHNGIEGALEAQALGDVRVIIGEEISSSDGHLLGLFLRERIPFGLSGEETCAAIHAQEGLARAPPGSPSEPACRPTSEWMPISVGSCWPTSAWTTSPTPVASWLS
jgi:predicted metal-dependent phosphoesterase TrpH